MDVDEVAEQAVLDKAEALIREAAGLVAEMAVTAYGAPRTAAAITATLETVAVNAMSAAARKECWPASADPADESEPA